jgi:hypothetical protein
MTAVGLHLHEGHEALAAFSAFIISRLPAVGNGQSGRKDTIEKCAAVPYNASASQPSW